MKQIKPVGNRYKIIKVGKKIFIVKRKRNEQ